MRDKYRSQCDCECHKPGAAVLHFIACCDPDPVIIPHSPEGIPDCGSFEVNFFGERESNYFYWDDNDGRRSITGQMTQAEAKTAAEEFVRKEVEK